MVDRADYERGMPWALPPRSAGVCTGLRLAPLPSLMLPQAVPGVVMPSPPVQAAVAPPRPVVVLPSVVAVACNELHDLLRSAIDSPAAFPVDFDAAMRATAGLGFATRADAVRALESSFCEGPDYVRTSLSSLAMTLQTFVQLCVMGERIDRGVVTSLVLVLSQEALRGARVSARERDLDRRDAELAARAHALASKRRRTDEHTCSAGEDVPSSFASSPESHVVSACSSPVVIASSASASAPAPLAAPEPQGGRPEVPAPLRSTYREWTEFPKSAVLTSKAYLEFRGIDAEKVGCHTFGRIVAKMCTASGIASERLVAYRNPEDLPAFERAFEMWEKQNAEHPLQALQRPAKRSKPMALPVRWLSSASPSAPAAAAAPALPSPVASTQHVPPMSSCPALPSGIVRVFS
eukprot:m51a1_g14649 hypothetical protein (408) ;mRNA; f:100093-102166